MGRGLRAFAEASVVLDLLEGNSRGSAFSKTMALGDREWCFSPLVRMECRVRSLSKDDQKALARLDSILSAMIRLDLTDKVFDSVAELRAHTGLKTPDALHVATALEHGCAEQWTADSRIAKASVQGLAVRLVA